MHLPCQPRGSPAGSPKVTTRQAGRQSGRQPQGGPAGNHEATTRQPQGGARKKQIGEPGRAAVQAGPADALPAPCMVPTAAGPAGYHEATTRQPCSSHQTAHNAACRTTAGGPVGRPRVDHEAHHEAATRQPEGRHRAHHEARGSPRWPVGGPVG